MAKVRFELNRQGVRELLRSQEMLDICTEYANNALARLGDGYEVNTMTGAVRVNAEVYAQSFAAKRENRKSNTMCYIIIGT